MARRPPPFEGSAKDKAQDAKGARKMGISKKAYEKTPQDRAQDRAGQAAMRTQSAPPMPAMGGGSGAPGSPLGFARGGKVGRGKRR